MIFGILYDIYIREINTNTKKHDLSTEITELLLLC